MSLASGKVTPWREGRADQNEGGGFRGALRGETGGGFFGFAENVRDFVFAADIGVALEFAEAGGGEEDGATGGELGFHVADARDYVAMKTRAGARTEFKAAAAVLFEIELLEFDARGFRQGALPLGVVPVIVGDLGRIGVALAFVVFRGGFAEFFAGFAQICGFIQKDDGLQRTFGKFKQSAAAGFAGAAEPTAAVPILRLLCCRGRERSIRRGEG